MEFFIPPQKQYRVLLDSWAQIATFVSVIPCLGNQTWCPKKNDTVTVSHNFRLNYPNSTYILRKDVMSTRFQTLCSKPRAIRLSSFEDMSDYVTEFKNTFIQ